MDDTAVEVIQTMDKTAFATPELKGYEFPQHQNRIFRRQGLQAPSTLPKLL